MDIDNKKIINKLIQGDFQVFEKIFKKYYQGLCYYALKYVKENDTAEELVQDLFYKIWEKHESLDIQTSLKAYLFNAVRNNSLKYLEHLRIVNNYAKNYNPEKEYMESSDDLVKMTELQNRIDSTLGKMPKRVRSVFTLSRYDGLKYKEIAEKLNISVKTVEANMGTALKIFRKTLKDYRI